MEGLGTPALLRRFGADYVTYRLAVPAWLPRPWKVGPEEGNGGNPPVSLRAFRAGDRHVVAHATGPGVIW